VDDQAIDRAFRIGQKRNVLCYRFVTVGTVEEKMTRIQVRKTSIARKVLKSEYQRSYSTLDELRDLFSLSEPDSDDCLFRVLQRQPNLPRLEKSVRETLQVTESNDHSTEEILSQLRVLSGADNNELSISRLGLLVTNGTIAGVSDRACLFAANDNELAETLQGLSLDDREAMDHVVENAIGWAMTRRKDSA
jgi:hypothetical protein